MKLARPVAAGLVLLFITACAPTFPQIVPNQNSPIRTVAVLPLVNNSNDVDAPAYVRDIFVAELGQFFYVIKPANEVDQILKNQMGVTLGSQLDMTTPQKLGEVLGVDGVFYGSLDEFSEKITGVYNASVCGSGASWSIARPARRCGRTESASNKGLRRPEGASREACPF
jgi:hypothetical protein